jgi:hypothetical protein
MKPHVFVSSSSEGLVVADAIQENLERTVDVVVWDQDVFRPGEYVLESLLREVNRADAAILVFTPDDVVTVRGVEQTAVRDNVLFELGLFVGKLGRDRSFVVAPRDDTARLASNLVGVNLLGYEPRRADGNLVAALGPACSRIRRALADVVPRREQSRRDLDLPVFERRDLLSGTQRRLLGIFEDDPAPSRRELRAAFAGDVGAELHYRMEHLRLMGFLERTDAAEGPRWTLSRSYLAAKAARDVDWARVPYPGFPADPER